MGNQIEIKSTSTLDLQILNLVKRIADVLNSSAEKLCVAESMTAGLLASSIVDLAGASAYFEGGVISYSNRQKHDLLGVSHEILEKFGAVSPQCARAMASGVAKLMGCKHAISVTGFAEREGEDLDSPLVFVGIHSNENTHAFKLNLSAYNTRNEIRQGTVLLALRLFYEQLKN